MKPEELTKTHTELMAKYTGRFSAKRPPEQEAEALEAANKLIEFASALDLPADSPAVELACLELLESYGSTDMALAKQRWRLFDYVRNAAEVTGHIAREERKVRSMERHDDVYASHAERFNVLLEAQNAIFARIASALEAK